jgi:hypothetical protein
VTRGRRERSHGVVEQALTSAARTGAGLDVLSAHCMPPSIRSSLLIWVAGGPRPAWDLAERQLQKALARRQAG